MQPEGENYYSKLEHGCMEMRPEKVYQSHIGRVLNSMLMSLESIV